MNSKLQSEHTDALADAFLTLKTREEVYSFFEDLCTIAELKAMSQRFYVAKMLDKKTPYSDIVKETGVSTATISRVNRALNYGADGYRIILERMKSSEDEE